MKCEFCAEDPSGCPYHTTYATGLGGRVSEAPARGTGGVAEVEALHRAVTALSPEAEREHDIRNAVLGYAGGHESLTDTVAALLRLLRSPVASLAPRTPWAVSALPLSCDPAWEIGIVGKGPREWFDTKADAERAVALLNVATMPPSSLAPTSLAEIPEAVEAAARTLAEFRRAGQGSYEGTNLAGRKWLREQATTVLVAAEAARPPKGSE